MLSDYFRVHKRLPSVAGLVEGQVLDADGVKMLAELPSRDALLAQLAGTLLSPLTQLAGTLELDHIHLRGHARGVPRPARRGSVAAPQET